MGQTLVQIWVENCDHCHSPCGWRFYTIGDRPPGERHGGSLSLSRWCQVLGGLASNKSSYAFIGPEVIVIFIGSDSMVIFSHYRCSWIQEEEEEEEGFREEGVEEEGLMDVGLREDELRECFL